nr:Polygalacturonate 4-alpha-galacturonosyltransferase [Ipomoea batatas]
MNGVGGSRFPIVLIVLCSCAAPLILFAGRGLYTSVKLDQHQFSTFSGKEVFDVIKTSAEDLGQVIPDSFSKNNLLASWRFATQEVLAKNNSTYLEVGMMVRLKIGFYDFIYSMLP